MQRSRTSLRFVNLVRRPFLLAAVLVSVACLIYVKLFYKDPPLPGAPGETVTLCGKVRDKNYDEEGNLKSFTVGDALCACSDTDFVSEPKIGSMVSFSGTLREFRKPMNRGGFDERAYHRVRGENYWIILSEAMEIKEAKFFLPDELCKLKVRFASAVDKFCPLEAGTVKTLILGDKSSLSDERKNLYQRVSLSHFLIISGLHISAFAGALYRTLRSLFRKKVPASFATLLMLVLYGLMIGFSVSVLRAVIMYAIRLLADLTGETYDTLSAAGLAAVITLIKNPLHISDSSFLYSYIAVLTIGSYYDSGAVTGLRGIKEKIKDAVKFSMVMVFGMFPVTMFFSGTYSLGALILNLFIIPFGPVMLFMAFAAFLFSTLGFAPAAGFFDFLEACLIRLTDVVARITAKGSFLRLSGKPSVFMVAACYGVLLWFLYRGKKHLSGFACMAVLTGIIKCLSTVWWWSPALSMLYVGQGECMVMRTGVRSAVILDCGSTSDSEVYKYNLLPWLYTEGITGIDALFLSHSDKDHVSGIEELLEDLDTSGLSVKRIIMPRLEGEGDSKLEAITRKAREENITSYKLSAGDRAVFGGWQFECLWPKTGHNFNNANDDSLVLLAGNAHFSLMLTGDISEKTERELLRLYEEDFLDADILKVAHHGSKTATSDEFVSAVSPVAAIASAGINNRYHHPSDAVRERMALRGTDLYCTKESGEIDLVPAMGKNKLIIKSYKGE